MSDIHASTGVYALVALEAAERAEFEAHLAGCATCRDEVARFEEIAAELSVLSLASPPRTQRADVLASISSTPQDLAPTGGSTPPVTVNGSRPGAGSRRTAPATGPRRAAPEPEVPERDDERDQPVDELALRRQRRRTRLLSGLVAALLALTVGLGGVVSVLVQGRQAQVAQVTLEKQLYAAPDAVTTTEVLPDGGQVTFIASRQLNRAMFLGTALPDPGPNRYQLWTGTGDPTVEDAITGVTRDSQIADTDSGVKVYFSGNIADADFLAVNLEPAESTPDAPTSAVLAAGPTST